MKKYITIFIILNITQMGIAQPFVRWDFNSNPADGSTSTGTTNTVFGTGGIALIGGTTNTYAAGNGGTATNDNSAFNTTAYPTQGTANETAGVEFSLSTLGKTGIVVGWSQRHSNTSCKFIRFQYTTNGTTWITPDLTTTNTAGSENGVDVTNDLFFATVGDQWSFRQVDLTSITAANNNSNFKFRMVTSFEPSTSNYTASTSTSSYATTGTLRLDDVTIGENSTLPTKIKGFSALNLQGNVQLNWLTNNEINVKQFEIEKSWENNQFLKLATLEAKNNSQNSYTFIDRLVTNETIFYRLKIVERDGSFKYSSVIRTEEKRNSKLNVYPNPTNTNTITITHSPALKNTRVSILSNDGKLLQSYKLAEGSVSNNILLNNLVAGKCYLRIESENSKQEIGFIKL